MTRGQYFNGRQRTERWHFDVDQAPGAVRNLTDQVLIDFIETGYSSSKDSDEAADYLEDVLESRDGDYMDLPDPATVEFEKIPFIPGYGYDITAKASPLKDREEDLKAELTFDRGENYFLYNMQFSARLATGPDSSRSRLCIIGRRTVEDEDDAREVDSILERLSDDDPAKKV